MTTLSPLHRTAPALAAGFQALLAAPLLLAVALAGASSTARASSDRLMPANVPAAYTQECASCHLAHPPALLPARSWQRVMGALDKHYGSDATVDAALQRQISTWLQANAGTYKRVVEEPPQDRITRAAWFLRKHRGVDVTVWKLPSVKSPANCAACHGGADRGVFDDDELKFPAGMDPRLGRLWRD